MPWCDFHPVHLWHVSFRRSRPNAASQATRRQGMKVLCKFAQPWITHMHIFWCLLDPTKTCSFIGLIEVCRILTGLFWDAADSFAGLFDRFYYIFYTLYSFSDGLRIVSATNVLTEIRISFKKTILNKFVLFILWIIVVDIKPCIKSGFESAIMFRFVCIFINTL